MSAPDPVPSPLSASIAASHDVLIVGGGLVGASLAIALDRLGLDVGLLEAAPAGALPAAAVTGLPLRGSASPDIQPRIRIPAARTATAANPM